ncbi:MAG: glycosyltransferase [Thermoanaerobaculia bacterium]
MHVLILPSWYNTVDKPSRGTFFADQAQSLLRHGLRVGMAFVERRSLSGLTPLDLLRHHFQVTSGDERGVPTLRMKGWSTFAQTTAGALLWAQLTRSLVRSYVDTYGVPDVIHGHAAMWGGYTAMLCARDIGRPYVVTEHSSSILTLRLSRSNRRRVAATYRNAARVIAVSRALKVSVDCVAGRSTADVVPNTVDSDYFNMPAHPRTARPFVFLAVGDLVTSKRTDLLLHAFARLHRAEPQTRLVIVGGGKESGRLQELMHGLDLSDAVEFTGPLTRPAVRQRMWEANALVLPSDFETFGVVLLEAMSTGLPVIATRCGGPEEIVSDGAGTLIDCNDEEGLLHAMSEHIAGSFDPMHIRNSVIRRFGYPEVARRLCDIYDSVTSVRREEA